jgi:TldD protein
MKPEDRNETRSLERETSLATANQILLAPYALDDNQLDTVFGQIMAHRVEYADLYFQYTRSESWSLEEGIVKSGSFNIDQGVGVRAVSGEKTAFAYSDDISLAALTSAAHATRAIARQGETGRTQVVERAAGHNLYVPYDPLASLDDRAKVELLERIERYARALDPRVAQVMAYLAGEYEVVLIARSDGALAADVRPLTRLSLQVIVEKDGRREQGSAGGGGPVRLRLFHRRRLEGLREEGSRPGARQSRRASCAGRDHDSGAGTGLARGPPARGRGTRARGRLQPQGHLGIQRQDRRARRRAGRHGGRRRHDRAPARLPQHRRRRQPTQRNVLIENGVLKSYMQDSLNARLMKVAPTGNGRRESYAHIPMPRMTNTYMLNGDRTRDEIIASVKDGLYAVNFGGGQVDITSGKFVFSASEAYIIENGKVSYPVKGATLIGNGPDALTRVAMIGNDMALDTGVAPAARKGRVFPVGVGQPTLRIDGLTVGGTV